MLRSVHATLKETRSMVCAAIVKQNENFALLMGENKIAISGKYGNTHIFLGIPVATKQSPDNLIYCTTFLFLDN